MIQDRMFKTGATESRPGKLFASDKPVDGGDVVLMWNHGVSEAGDGTLANLPRLTANMDSAGPFPFISDSQQFIFKNPNDGKNYRFILVGLQGNRMDTPYHWCCFPNQIAYAVQNDIKKAFPNVKAVFISGLSSGGAETINSISTEEFAPVYTAAVPMSPASGGVDPAVTAKYNIKLWTFSETDWTGAYRNNAENFTKKVNAIKPDLAKLSYWTGGHGGWSLKYNPDFKENGQNIYEWMLTQYKPVDNPPTPIPVPPKIEPVPTPAPAPQPTPTLSKIPVNLKRFYQENNFERDLTRLMDGKTERFVTGYGQMINPYEIWYEFPEDQNAIIYKFRMWDAEGTWQNHPLKIFGIKKGSWVKELIATWTAPKYLEWGEVMVANPVEYKYLILLVYTEGGAQTLPPEMEWWGTFNPSYKEPELKPVPSKPFKQYLGVNMYEWNLLENPEAGKQWIHYEIYPKKWDIAKVFNQYRHYLSWKKIELEKGTYSFNPTRDGSWFNDVLYEKLSSEGRFVLVDLKDLPEWMISTYPEGQRDTENVPMRFGSDPSDPNSYIDYALMDFQFTARYGRTMVDKSLLSVYTIPAHNGATINEIKTGLGTVHAIEVGNERDKWWKGRKGYQTGREYAAYLSAAYDGHMGTMGKNVGIKTADPTMIVIIAGTAQPEPDYNRGIVDWCKEHRNGSLPFDAYNYHIYANDAGSVQFGGSVKGICPEASVMAEKADNFNWFNQTFGYNKEIWVTETGYDIHQLSPQRVMPIGTRTVLQVQADWIIRTCLLYASKGHDRLFFYELYDNAPGSKELFMTSGFSEYDLNPRPALNYIAQIKKVLGDFHFDSEISSVPRVHKYVNGEREIFVAWMPTEEEKSFGYEHKLIKSKLNLLKIYDFIDEGFDMESYIFPDDIIILEETPCLFEVVQRPLIQEVNYLPVADAGKDIEAAAGKTISLSAIGSIDSDGDISAWKWKKIKGPAKGKISYSTRKETTVAGLVPGTYVFELAIWDNKNGTATDLVTVTIK